MGCMAQLRSRPQDPSRRCSAATRDPGVPRLADDGRAAARRAHAHRRQAPHPRFATQGGAPPFLAREEDRPGSEGHMATFKHVLAATDFSETSGRALEMAVGIARDAGAELERRARLRDPALHRLRRPARSRHAGERSRADEARFTLLLDPRRSASRVKGSSGSARRGRRSSPSPPSAARTSSSSALTGAAASRTRPWAASRSASCGCPRSRC